jgi:hypothetical protein
MKRTLAAVPFEACVLSLAIAFACAGVAQNSPAPSPQSSADQPEVEHHELPVSWIYGAYVPKEAPLEPLSDADRWRLFVRMSFTTPGIYIKTGFFGVRDQITGAPPGWPQNAQGFGQRLGNRYAQFLIQNSFTAIGDAMPGWEVRYDRCRNCESVKQRIWHATYRNFVTYGSDEKSLRPQVFLYGASFGGAALSAYWQPYRPNPIVKGYQGVATQAWVGVLINLVSEFAPDVKRAIHREKKSPPPAATTP